MDRLQRLMRHKRDSPEWLEALRVIQEEVADEIAQIVIPKSAGTVIPNDKIAGQSVVINSTLNVGSGVQRGELEIALQQQRVQIKADVYESMRRGRWDRVN